MIRYANDNNRRYNLRLNYDYDFSKRTRLESKLSLDNQDRSDLGGLGHQSWCGCPWVVVEGIFGMPNHPIYTESGQHFFVQGGWGNAVAQAKEAATATFTTRSVNTNFKLIVEPLDGLKLNLQSGLNYRLEDNTDIAKSFPLYRWDDRKHGIGQDTFYRWKRLYGGLEREELQRVRALEEENKRLKRVVADQALNLQLLQDKLGKRS